MAVREYSLPHGAIPAFQKQMSAFGAGHASNPHERTHELDYVDGDTHYRIELFVDTNKRRALRDEPPKTYPIQSHIRAFIDGEPVSLSDRSMGRLLALLYETEHAPLTNVRWHGELTKLVNPADGAQHFRIRVWGSFYVYAEKYLVHHHEDMTYTVSDLLYTNTTTQEMAVELLQEVSDNFYRKWVRHMPINWGSYIGLHIQYEAQRFLMSYLTPKAVVSTGGDGGWAGFSGNPTKISVIEPNNIKRKRMIQI